MAAFCHSAVHRDFRGPKACWGGPIAAVISTSLYSEFMCAADFSTSWPQSFDGLRYLGVYGQGARNTRPVPKSWAEWWQDSGGVDREEKLEADTGTKRMHLDQTVVWYGRVRCGAVCRVLHRTDVSCAVQLFAGIAAVKNRGMAATAMLMIGLQHDSGEQSQALMFRRTEANKIFKLLSDDRDHVTTADWGFLPTDVKGPVRFTVWEGRAQANLHSMLLSPCG
ncbi:unnamed protein product [Diplocarpon coronariae]